MTLLLHNIAATFQHTQSGRLLRNSGKHHWKLANPLMMCACLSDRCIYINLIVGEFNFLFEQLRGDSLSGHSPGKPLSTLVQQQLLYVFPSLPSLPSIRQSLNIIVCASSLLQEPGNSSCPKLVS